MFRRISTKWLFAVLAAVVLPFVGFAWYVNFQMSNRLEDVVRYYLLSLASDLADRLDRDLDQRRLDIELWADLPIAEWAVGDYDGEVPDLRTTLGNAFDRYVPKSEVYDLLLAVDSEGRYAISSTVDSAGNPLPIAVLTALEARDYSSDSWFQACVKDGMALTDQHEAELIPRRKPEGGPHPENFHIGIAARVVDPLEPERALGVIYGLINWSYYQNEIIGPARRAHFQGLIGQDIYASSYAWLWKSDANTIIGHPRRDLYGRRVAEDVGLPVLVDAARASDWDMFPEYEFNGERKNAAFKHCAGPEDGGLGWVVGIGIDNEDIYRTVYELRRVLWTATLTLLGIVVAWTVWFARRTTAPISALHAHTRRVAAGDLEARINIASRDELGELGDAFNRMTAELAENREQLVKSEKDAAWREMARQVAHEIKNPLTPIALSVALLKRAHADRSPEFESILERTVDLVQRQVENMRAIASDFQAFAGVHKPELTRFDVGGLLDEIVELNAAWATELGVKTEHTPGGGEVLVDRNELHRVLINLVSNALEAMPEGGRLEIETQENDAVEIIIRDTGHGVPDDVRARLFEPYFTTRSHGTGLGLAITRRLLEEMGGTIVLEDVEDGPGTRAIVCIPKAPPISAQTGEEERNA